MHILALLVYIVPFKVIYQILRFTKISISQHKQTTKKIQGYRQRLTSFYHFKEIRAVIRVQIITVQL